MQKRHLLLISAIALQALCGASVRAGEVEGHAVADRWCAQCHVVSSGQTTAIAGVPSFADIAKRRTNAEIAGFLADPHPTMKGIGLSTAEITDVGIYIRSLATAP